MCLIKQSYRPISIQSISRLTKIASLDLLLLFKIGVIQTIKRTLTPDKRKLFNYNFITEKRTFVTLCTDINLSSFNGICTICL